MTGALSATVAVVTVGDQAAAWFTSAGVPLVAGAVLAVVLASACFVLMVRLALSALSAGD